MSALTSFYRALTRHRLFAALNISGLALGIAVFLVLHLFVRFERSYDRWLPDADKLYLVRKVFHFPNIPETPIDVGHGSFLDELRGDYPNVRGTRIWAASTTIRRGSAATAAKLSLVDHNFFALFRYRFLAGDPRTALSVPDGLVVTRTVAERYFAPGRALGASLDLVIEGKPFRYRVTGVVEPPPAATTLDMTLMAPLTMSRFKPAWGWDAWGNGSVSTILYLPTPEAARALQQRMPRFVAEHGRRQLGDDADRKITLSFLPFTGLHLDRPGDRVLVSTLEAVGLIALAIAILNYVNLATAQAGLRAREVAVRKVVGGTRRVLAAQFLGEAIATAGLATLAGLALAELALPWINAATGASLRLIYLGTGSILPGAVLLTVAVGLLAGATPALLISRFQASAVLASVRAPGGGRAGRRLRQALVVGQFAAAITLTIGTTVLVSQTRHLRQSDLGFRRDGLLLIKSFVDPALSQSQRDQLTHAFAALPGISGVGIADDAPGYQISTNGGEIGPPDISTHGHLPTAFMVSIGRGFFDAYRPRLLAGRLFDDDHPGEALGDTQWDTFARLEHGAVVSRQVAERLGFARPAQAIGRPFRWNSSVNLRIIGVIDDMRFGTPRERPMGTVYLYYPNGPATQIATLRYTGADPRAVQAAAEQAWRRIAPGTPFDGEAVDAQLFDQFYKGDVRRARLFTLGAVLAVAIGCIGLYGLAAFDTARRVKEIGIRKTLGASTGDVLRLLIGQFMRPVLLANLLAWPIAFVAMRRWLAGFDDRVALSPWLFLLVSAGAALIAALTVVGQAWRVARAEPARALRYE